MTTPTFTEEQIPVCVREPWGFVNATLLVDCTNCGQQAGHVCRAPAGRKCTAPHNERMQKFLEKWPHVHAAQYPGTPERQFVVERDRVLTEAEEKQRKQAKRRKAKKAGKGKRGLPASRRQ